MRAYRSGQRENLTSSSLDSPVTTAKAPRMLMTFFREEHEIFRKTLRDFVAKEMAPYANEWEAKKEFPRSIFKRCGELGFLGAHYPTDVGGAGGDWWYA